MSEIIMKAKL